MAAVAQAQSAAATGKTGDLISVGNGNDTLVGGNGNDLIFLGGGSDTLVLGAGDSVVYGGQQASSANLNWTEDTVVTDPKATSNSYRNLSYASTGGYTPPAQLVQLEAQFLTTEYNPSPNGSPVGGGNETILGGTGNYFIEASNGDNYIDAGSGNSDIFGGGGNDTIFASGNSNIVGGGGNDYIDAEAGNEVIEGGAGNNTIVTGTGNNKIYAGVAGYTAGGGNYTADINAGNNYVQAGSGQNTIYGSAGADTLIAGGGNDLIYAGNGNTTIVGGSGASTLEGGELSASYTGPESTVIQSAAGNDYIVGNDGNNSLYGGSGQDTLYAGNDGAGWADSATNTSHYVQAGSGDSVLYGSGGSDTLMAGSGNDTIYAGDGAESLYGGDGGDTIYGGGGTNIFTGGVGSDSMVGGSGVNLFTAGGGQSTMVGGGGNNTYQLNAGFGGVEIDPASADDSVAFGAGIALSDLTLSGGFAADGSTALVIDDADGDSLTIKGGLDGAENSFTFAGGATLSLSELMAQTNANDSDASGANGDLLFTDLNGDSLTGGSGNDTLYGWGGADTLTAGGGNDTLIAEQPNAVLVDNSGNSNETFVIHDAGAVVQAAAGSGVNTLQASVSYVLPENVQNLTLTGSGYLSGAGNDQNDVITAASGNDTLTAGSGLATLIGGAGNETFVVDNVQDVVVENTAQGVNGIQSSVSYVLPANVQNLTLTGDANLTATGNGLNDTLTANNGDDTLISGAGVDTLYGGSGNDTFIVNNGNDLVLAYNAGGNINSVLSAVSYVQPANVQNLTLTGSANLTATALNANSTITANGGADTLIDAGGAGSLVGGAGTDTFVMDSADGVYTVSKQASANAIVQLGSILNLSVLSATRSGNDLLLGAGENGGMLLQNYFLDPGAWTLQDAAGAAASIPALITATAQAQANRLAYLENQFLSQSRIDIVEQLQQSGYTQQSADTWGYSTQNPAEAQWTLSSTKTSYEMYNPALGVYYYTQPQAAGSASSWSPSAWASVTDYTASIQQITTNTDDAVITANTGGYSESQASGYYNANWTVFPSFSSYTYTYDTYYSYPNSILYNFFPVEKLTVTTQQFAAQASVSGPLLTNTGGETLGGYEPQLVYGSLTQYTTTDVIQQIDVGAGDHTVYGGQYTLVVSGSGDNSIYNAGFVDAGTGNDYIDYAGVVYSGASGGNDTIFGADLVYGGGGDDVITNSTTVYGGGGAELISNANTVYAGSGADSIYGANLVYGGSGADLIVGAVNVVAGSGNETIFGAGAGDILINPALAGVDLIGNTPGASLDKQLLQAYYAAQNVGDALERYEYGGMYYAYGGYYDTYQEAEQWAEYGSSTITYIQPLPSWVWFADGALRPSSYYAASDVPLTAFFTANDAAQLAPYFDDGALPAETVTFAAGLSLADIKFGWGQAVTALSGLATDPQLPYTTLDLSWGKNQGIDVIIPRSGETIGSGIQEFVFADGSRYSLAQMIAMAPPAPSFDPAIIYQLGMGASVLPAGENSIQFGGGIGFGNLQFQWQGANLLIDYGSQGDSVLASGFTQNGANNLQFQLSGGEYGDFAYDGQGELMQTDYAANGFKFGDSWVKADGSHGSDTFNADGSSSSITYNADGGYFTGATDSQGNFMQTDYSAAGVKLSDAWTKTNGTHGGDTFNADGSIDSVAYNANGSYADTTNDGQGDIVQTDYAANGTETGDSWQNADGSHGSDTFNADGSSSGVAYNADCSRYNYIQNSRGDYFEQYYSSTGVMTAENWSYVNGLNESLVFNADGSHTTVINDGKGNTTTTNYSAQGKKLSDRWQDANGESGSDVYNADGSVEAKVTNPSDGGLIYITDTITSPDGSYRQTWSKSDGGSGVTDYIAATNETFGSVAQAGAGYTYVFDDTKLAGGATEAKLTYIYSNGSTYSTDTVNDADGSYQQSWSKSDGSTGSTDYVAATGELSGSLAQAGSGYIYVYDRTKLAGGATETKATYIYTDGSSYNAESINYADGSNIQNWTRSNGNWGGSAVNAAGALVYSDWGQANGLEGVDAGGSHLLASTAANASLSGGAGNYFLAAGQNDVLATGGGVNIIAYDQGGGNDVVNAGSGQNNVLSLGGDFALSDLAFQKQGNNLVLDVGAADTLTFLGWFGSAANRTIVDLQVIEAAASDYNPGSADVSHNSQVEEFNFQALVNAFDQAIANNPKLNAWSLTNDLLNAHLSGSNNSALGGDLAYTYGMQGSLAGMSVAAVAATLTAGQFGTAPQAIQVGSALNTGTARLH